MGGLSVNRPVSIDETHRFADFDCGNISLNVWLEQRALSNHQKGASKVFVSVDENGNTRLLCTLCR